MNTTQSARAFFYEHAGYSVKPGETREQGRNRSARELAKAELLGRDAGMSFAWDIDENCNSSDFSHEVPAWELWTCTAYNGQGEVCASLCGIDFDRDGKPWGNSYCRVVEAELASEALHAAELDKRRQELAS